MSEILLPVAISFIITFFCTPVIIKIANLKKLFDAPDERKVHTDQIAPLGGLAIFAGFTMASLIGIAFSRAFEFQYFIAAAVVILFLGLKDDILAISPLKKLIGQLIAAFLIIYKGGIQIQNMHGFFGIHELPYWSSVFLTYLTVVLIINAFNLIDGVDGLAGSLGLMASLIFGFYFLVTGSQVYSILAFSMASSLAAFLYFNFQPAKIFMGDCGSLLVGLVCAILVIKFINIAPINPKFTLSSSLAIGFSILSVPLLDTLRVFSIRLMNGRSPFSADRNHVHHILLNSNLSHRSITFTLVAVNLLFVITACFAGFLGDTSLVLLETGLFFLGLYIFIHAGKNRFSNSTLVKGKHAEQWEGATKVVALKSKNTVKEPNPTEY